MTTQTISDTDFFKSLKNILVNCDDKWNGSLRTIFESDIGLDAAKNLFI